MIKTAGEGWIALTGTWLITCLIFIFWLFTNIFLGTLVGAFTAWLLSFTFMGDWITAGLNSINIKAVTGDLYNIGAAAGFASGFFKFSFTTAKK